MKQIRIVFMGTPKFAAYILEGLIEKKYNIVGLISQPDRKKDKNHQLELTPTKEIAIANNIPVYQPEKIKNDYDFLSGLKPDIIITCAYGQIVPDGVLNAAKYGAINIHASLLPLLRGGAPIHRAIMNGFDITGVTIMKMVSKMDAGVMYSKEATPIIAEDNVLTLHDRLEKIGLDLLIKTLPSIIDGSNKGIEQNESEVTFGYNIKKEEEKVNWNKTSVEIFNHIRGLFKWPTAYTTYENKVFKIYQSRIVPYSGSENPGTVISIEKDGIAVKTLDGKIVITELQQEGKKVVSGKDFVNGNRNSMIGKVLL